MQPRSRPRRHRHDRETGGVLHDRKKEFPMITNALTVAQKLLVAGRKEVLAVGLVVLSTLGMIHPANAQKVIYTIFDPPGSTSTQPKSINARGAITGSYGDANYVLHGFLRAPDGTITTFDPPGAAYTFPASINRLGAIAGSYTDANFVAHGFLRSPDGTITTLDPPGSYSDPGGPGTGASAINGAGEITGSYEGKPNAQGRIAIHGFLRSRAGTFTRIDAVPGAPVTVPTGINAEGAITGG